MDCMPAPKPANDQSLRGPAGFQPSPSQPHMPFGAVPAVQEEQSRHRPPFVAAAAAVVAAACQHAAALGASSRYTSNQGRPLMLMQSLKSAGWAYIQSGAQRTFSLANSCRAWTANRLWHIAAPFCVPRVDDAKQTKQQEAVQYRRRSPKSTRGHASSSSRGAKPAPGQLF